MSYRSLFHFCRRNIQSQVFPYTLFPIWKLSSKTTNSMVFTSCQNLEVQPSKTCLWQIYFLIQQTNCNSQILTQLSLDQSNSYLLSHISWHKMLTVEQILIPSSMEQHVGRTELLPECHNMHTELSTTGNLRHYLQLPTFSDSEWQYSLPASCRNFPSGATA